MAVNTVNVALEITDEQLDTLLICALQGGSNYWIERMWFEPRPRDSKSLCNYETMFSDGRTGRIFAEDAEDDGGYVLDKAAALRGIQLLATYHPKRMNNVLIENEDAEDADVWLQLALFGEVVYG